MMIVVVDRQADLMMTSADFPCLMQKNDWSNFVVVVVVVVVSSLAMTMLMLMTMKQLVAEHLEFYL